MSEHVQAVMEHNSELEQLGNLTRRELKELEEKEKTPVQKVEEALIMALRRPRFRGRGRDVHERMVFFYRRCGLGNPPSACQGIRAAEEL